MKYINKKKIFNLILIISLILSLFIPLFTADTSQSYINHVKEEKLLFEKDAVRTEGRRLAGRIEALLEACYSNLGYTTIRVPVMPIDQRADFVMHHRAQR